MSSSPKPLAEINFEESELLKNIRQLPDPRTRWTKHSVLDIVTIAVMAVLSGSNDWNAIQVYGEAKKECRANASKKYCNPFRVVDYIQKGLQQFST